MLPRIDSNLLARRVARNLELVRFGLRQRIEHCLDGSTVESQQRPFGSAIDEGELFCSPFSGSSIN